MNYLNGYHTIKIAYPLYSPLRPFKVSLLQYYSLSNCRIGSNVRSGKRMFIGFEDYCSGKISHIQGGPDSIRQFLIINNQSIQQHKGKWESTFYCR
jgi:hypothetical protein